MKAFMHMQRGVIVLVWALVITLCLAIIVLALHFVDLLFDPAQARALVRHPMGWNYQSIEVYLASLLISIIGLALSAWPLVFGLWRRRWGFVVIGVTLLFALGLFSRTVWDERLTLWLAQYMPAPM